MFPSSGCFFSKIDSHFNIIVIFFLRPMRTYRTSTFECHIGKAILFSMLHVLKSQA